MPKVPRKGFHLLMPGSFFCLGTHHSQHAGARFEVENYGPNKCRCGRVHCDPNTDWRAALETARQITLFAEAELARAMPTEFARQAALPENLLEAQVCSRG